MTKQVTIPVKGDVLVYIDDELPIEEQRKKMAEAVLEAERHGNDGSSRIHLNFVHPVTSNC